MLVCTTYFESLRCTIGGELRFQLPSRAVEAKAMMHSNLVGAVGRGQSHSCFLLVALPNGFVKDRFRLSVSSNAYASRLVLHSGVQ